MSQVITKRFRVSRRRFLQGLTLAGGAVQVGLPPLVSMFNSTGTAYAADGVAGKPIESRFVFWFNGNGIPERYWMPTETGPDYHLSPCLNPLARFRDDIHVLSGLDNQAATASGPGNGHHKAISGVTTCTPFTGHGAGGASIDQAIAARIGRDSRFSSIQIGVSQESFGESIQRNMSWAGYDRPLPPQMLPNKLFDYLFGAREAGWVNRKRSILDAVRQDAADLQKEVPKDDAERVEEHLSAIRDMERAIAGLPAEYRRVDPPDYDGDMKDWPRIAKLQSDLLAQALVTRQTRVASYMLTKGQGLARFPWLGLTAARHHDYTHADGKAPGADGADGQRVLRDITRWHAEEFAYLVAKLKSIPEGDGTVLDHCCLLYAHEHAEANPHKCSGLAMIVAGHAGRLKTGSHTRVMGTIGDLYLTLADDIMEANLGRFPTASKKIGEILA
jgi:Protein of unknown function (DUF1552)